MKKCAIDYSKFLTEISKRRKPNLIRVLTEAYMKHPEALFFAGGMPNPEMFPFKEISITHSDGTKKSLTGTDLYPALQYGATQGYLPLLKIWRKFQTKWHSPKYNDWDVHVSTGSMDGCSIIFEMLVSEGEPAMVQVPIYTGVLNVLLPMKTDLIGINMDDDGAIPEEIERVCEERLKNGRPLPKFLYVNPTGSNPVGNVYSNDRKEKIYKLAQKYDFLIVEDDAYYFLHFLDEQPRSFLSYDVDGRVLRLDSFSKVLSAGIRLGTITGPKTLLSKIGLHMACRTLHAPSLSQVIVDKLLQTWNDEELQRHFTNVQKFYRDRRDTMVSAAEKHFKDIAEWSTPKGGMFMWVKINVLEDVYDLVMNTCVPQGVYVLPGHVFYPEGVDKPCQYLRICYSQANPKDIDEGFAKLAELIKKLASKSQNCVNSKK